MRKSWLLCVLLGTMAGGQAAPDAPAQPPQAPSMTRPQAPAPAADAAASVAPTAAVLTVNGVCPPQPKTAGAKEATAKTPECKTIITRAEFEKLANGLSPTLTPQLKRQLAGVLPRLMAMSDEAKKKGLDKTPQYEEMLKFARMQILSNELQRSIQEEASKISPEDIEKYYKEHSDAYEQLNVDRLFVPRAKQADAEPKDDDKDEKLSEEAQKAKQAQQKAKEEEGEQEMTKLADSLRARAAAGEDFVKLQKEAFDAAGMKIESPTVNLPTVRRTGLPPAHAAAFDLKPGEVSPVISDAGGHYVYKINSKSEIPLDQATTEIHNKLQSDRVREKMEKLSSFKVDTNEAYFGAAGPAAPPQRMGLRTAPPPGQTAPPQAGQPAAQPPAAKPN